MIGIDLAGPANAKDTAAACFRVEADQLSFISGGLGFTDEAVCDLVKTQADASDLIVGLDAPLSYQPGGGDRLGDTALRKKLIATGLHPGTVMPPTMTRMVYLTLRGMTIARTARLVAPEGQIVEVHPGGAMALRGAPVDAVRTFKRCAASRRMLVQWLASQGLKGVPEHDVSDHEIAAYGCALAAWQWHRGTPVWLTPADRPVHPFDFAC